MSSPMYSLRKGGRHVPISGQHVVPCQHPKYSEEGRKLLEKIASSMAAGPARRMRNPFSGGLPQAIPPPSWPDSNGHQGGGGSVPPSSSSEDTGSSPSSEPSLLLTPDDAGQPVQRPSSFGSDVGSDQAGLVPLPGPGSLHSQTDANQQEVTAGEPPPSSAPSSSPSSYTSSEPARSISPDPGLVKLMMARLDIMEQKVQQQEHQLMEKDRRIKSLESKLQLLNKGVVDDEGEDKGKGENDVLKTKAGRRLYRSSLLGGGVGDGWGGRGGRAPRSKHVGMRSRQREN